VGPERVLGKGQVWKGEGHEIAPSVGLMLHSLNEPKASWLPPLDADDLPPVPGRS